MSEGKPEDRRMLPPLPFQLSETSSSSPCADQQSAQQIPAAPVPEAAADPTGFTDLKVSTQAGRKASKQKPATRKRSGQASQRASKRKSQTLEAPDGPSPMDVCTSAEVPSSEPTGQSAAFKSCTANNVAPASGIAGNADLGSSAAKQVEGQASRPSSAGPCAEHLSYINPAAPAIEGQASHPSSAGTVTATAGLEISAANLLEGKASRPSSAAASIGDQLSRAASADLSGPADIPPVQLCKAALQPCSPAGDSPTLQLDSQQSSHVAEDDLTAGTAIGLQQDGRMMDQDADVPPCKPETQRTSPGKDQDMDHPASKPGPCQSSPGKDQDVDLPASQPSTRQMRPGKDQDVDIPASEPGTRQSSPVGSNVPEEIVDQEESCLVVDARTSGELLLCIWQEALYTVINVCGRQTLLGQASTDFMDSMQRCNISWVCDGL